MSAASQAWRRVATILVTVIGAGTVIYFVPVLALGRYATGWEPILDGYLTWWAGLAQGSFITPKVSQALPWTLTLVGMSTAIAFLIGTFAGALVASPVKRFGVVARWATPAALTLYATPFFVLGMVMIWVFVWLLDWFPSGGGYTLGETPEWNPAGVATLLWHGTLPFTSIVVAGIAQWLVLMRSVMVMTEGEDYVLLARSMGLNPWRVLSWYKMRNCLLPQITHLVMNMGLILTGTVLVEIVFAYPGIGYVLQQAILGNDFGTVTSVVITTSVLFALLLAVLEVAYPLIDRRIGIANG